MQFFGSLYFIFIPLDPLKSVGKMWETTNQLSLALVCGLFFIPLAKGSWQKVSKIFFVCCSSIYSLASIYVKEKEGRLAFKMVNIIISTCNFEGDMAYR